MHIARRKTRQISVGQVKIGGGAPVSVQSMCSTDTRDVPATTALSDALSRDLKRRGFKFVGSSFATDLRAPVLDWPVWPIQLAIPLGFLSAAGRYLFYAAWPVLRPQAPEFQE